MNEFISVKKLYTLPVTSRYNDFNSTKVITFPSPKIIIGNELYIRQNEDLPSSNSDPKNKESEVENDVNSSYTMPVLDSTLVNDDYLTFKTNSFAT